MAKKPYQPYADSYAAKTIALLMGLSPGTTVTAPYLAKHFGIAASSISSLFNASLQYGFLNVSKDDDGMLAYSLGPAALAQAGTLTPTSTPEEQDAFLQVHQHLVAAADRAPPLTNGLPSVFHLAGVLPEKEPTVPSLDVPVLVKLKTPKPPVVAPAAIPVPGLVCGLFNNGDLVVKAKGGHLTLDRKEVRELVDYLDQIATALEAAT